MITYLDALARRRLLVRKRAATRDPNESWFLEYDLELVDGQIQQLETKP